MTSAEFYGANGDYLLACVSDVGAVPSRGDMININKQTWKVVGVTWCVDHADSPGFTSALRANFTLEKI